MNKLILCFVLLVLNSGGLSAAEITVAVASNFKYTLQKLAADFKIETGHDLIISSASSGKLFAQIVQGAPYDVFLSADENRVDLLILKKFARVESAYIYAVGKLVLIANVRNNGNCTDVLKASTLRHLAIANPKIAPYGVAAKQVLANLKLWHKLQTRLVMGENIAQTFQFVATKNAGAGFVSQSMLNMAMHKNSNMAAFSCVWNIPRELYSPINQKMVILNKTQNRLAVQAFSRYIKSHRAREIIINTGYDVR
ncbi:MAG: molybdate ABC transporter substrate-binding protein [Gammaproteobacteria bacterium]|nr:molybdate ABC transporter substrate-binding protein [Gammaproteobacteria bacterium]